ncbi:MAG: DUF2933 domain-containing protein [Fidelibacterota bacterium]
MDWLQSNWFWILIIIFFMGMHLFGHRGHGGKHGGGCGGGHRDENKSGKKHDNDHQRHH